jgi:hypothetical protein
LPSNAVARLLFRELVLIGEFNDGVVASSVRICELDNMGTTLRKIITDKLRNVVSVFIKDLLRVPVRHHGQENDAVVGCRID